jgi:hypothetical protein
MDKATADARYRPFRAAVWVVYIAITAVIGTLVTIGVTKSVWSMTPKVHPTAGPLLTPSECLDKARALYAELDARRQALSAAAEVRKTDQDWTKFRMGWLTRMRDAEGACGVGESDREEIKKVYERLDKLMDLYTTHAVQFAGEVGPTLDALKASLHPRPGGDPTPPQSAGDPAR